MFDRDRSGQIDLNEFQALWSYIQQWRATFDQFDRDRSGSIDVNELNNGKWCLLIIKYLYWYLDLPCQCKYLILKDVVIVLEVKITMKK